MIYFMLHYFKCKNFYFLFKTTKLLKILISEFTEKIQLFCPPTLLNISIDPIQKVSRKSISQIIYGHIYLYAQQLLQ